MEAAVGTNEVLVRKLKDYLETREEVALAYLFGSKAKGTTTNESDIDIAVYFNPLGRALEYETTKTYPTEDAIWRDLGKITDASVDFVVLNRAPSTLFFAVLQEGIPLVLRNESLAWRLYLAVSDAAEEFRAFILDFARIKARS